MEQRDKKGMQSEKPGSSKHSSVNESESNAYLAAIVESSVSPERWEMIVA